MSTPVANWTSRSRSSRRRPRATNRGYYLPAAAALIVLILVLWQGPLSGRYAIPVPAAGENTTGTPRPAPAGLSIPDAENHPADNYRESRGILFLQKALGDTLPGLASPSLQLEAGLREAALSLFAVVTGMDPRDPCSILDRELGAGAGIPLPVYLPPQALPGPGEGGGAVPLPSPEAPGPGWTPLPPNFNRPDFPLTPGEHPTVLVYHTHITESFLPDSQLIYTEEMHLNMARPGAELAAALEGQYGLAVMHHIAVYDLPRHYSYEKARPALERLLAENTRLLLVVDLHRDGVSREVTTATLDGFSYGKILLVVGTNHPGYQNNLRLALHLHRELETLLPGVSRGIRQQPFVYNQDLHPYSLLVELGGHENSLAEISATLPYLAEALARTYHAFFLPR